jgi:pullulanase/glycogen debranching enzyme
MSRYSAGLAQGGPPQCVATEFKSLVKAAHKRGMEVILDVVRVRGVARLQQRC